MAVGLAALFLAPVALADHVFSHRLYIVGRVVDEAGVPVAGQAVRVTSESVRSSGGCIDSKTEVTGPMGDFEVCRHAHALPENATLVVQVAGHNETVALDHDLRRVAVHVRLPGATPGVDIGGWREFNRTYVVTGRHFGYTAQATNAEGVLVNASPIISNVSVTVRSGGDEIATAQVKPNEHGDFRASLDLEAIPAGTIVHVTSGREVVEKPASALFRHTDVQLVRDDRFARAGPGEDAPGTSTGKVPLPAGLLLVALALGAALARKRC